MSNPLEKYREQQRMLTWIRWKHLGHESEEEDQLLEEMDETWWQLSEEDRRRINDEPAREDLVSPSDGGLEMVDVDVNSEPGAVRKAAA